MQRNLSVRARLGVVALAGALLLGACASDDSDETTSAGGKTEQAGRDGGESGGSVIKSGWVNETDLESAEGGTLRVTLPAAPFGLDPTVA